MDKIILTEDKDFGEWVFSHHIKGISVILLRYQFKEQDEIIDSLVTYLKNNHNKLNDKFVTITTNKIRIRNL